MSTPDLTTFLQACGGTAPLQIAVARDDRAMGSMYRLAQPSILIGRHPRADLRLDDASVSQRHAYLQLIAGRVLCIDLESRTGTLQHRQPVSFTWLEPGDTIRIGPYRLSISNPVGVSDTTGLERWRQSLLRADLEISREGQTTTVWPMPQMIALVGGSQLCHLRLVGDRATRFAFSLVRTPVGVWMVDLGSSGGVKINDQLQRHALLAEGDTIPIGPYQIRMRYQASRTALESPPVARPNAPALRPLPADLVNPPTAAPRDATQLTTTLGPAPAETLLPAVHQLLEQVVHVQQQMSEQLPQAIAMITQAFGALQRDQLAVVRDELAEIRRLNQEIVSLRSASGRERPPATEPTSRSQKLPVGEESTTREHLARSNSRGPAAPELPSGTAAVDAMAIDPPVPQAPRFDPHQVGSFVDERLARVERERRSRWRKLLRAMLSS